LSRQVFIYSFVIMDSETHIFGTSPPLKTFEPHMSLSSMGDSRAGLPVSFLFSSLGSNPLCTRNFCPARGQTTALTIMYYVILTITSRPKLPFPTILTNVFHFLYITIILVK